MHKIPTFEDIRASILRDVVSLNAHADVSADSDNYLRASALASCAVGQYAHQTWILKQFFPDTADTEYLERHCNLHGLRRKSATLAAGTAIAHGNPGAIILAGTQIKCDALFYSVRTDATINENNTAILAIIAVDAGAAANQHDEKWAQFMSTPAGVSSDVQIISTSGGTDNETDAALLARLLELLRRPPAGGNKYDYKAWALSIDGVTNAYVYPLHRGLGTVDIVITSGNDIPSDDIVNKVQIYIDSVRPVTAKNSFVIKPDVTRVNIKVNVQLAGITLEEATANIKNALQEYFKTLEPGDAVIVSQLEAVISAVDGVADRKMIEPSQNLIAEKNKKIEWFMVGSIDVGLL